MRGAQLCKCAMTACTQLHTWQSRQELVTGAGGARGARRRRASGGGCRWMMPRWQRWPAWASSLRWCVRARSQRLVMHAFNCALLTMHARPLCICVRVAHLASMRRCAGRACHIFAACQHPRSFVVSPGRSAAAVHTVGAHTRPQTTPRCLQAVRALRFCAGDLPAAAAFAADERARARARGGGGGAPRPRGRGRPAGGAAAPPPPRARARARAPRAAAARGRAAPRAGHVRARPAWLPRSMRCLLRSSKPMWTA